nr:hypothetical protein [Tanacetum cinerariifolium]
MNLDTQVEQLAKDYKAKAANEVPAPSVAQCKAIFANNEALTDEASSKGTTKLQGVSFIFDDNVQVPEETKERVRDDMIIFDMNGNVHRPVILVKNAYMISDVQGEE